VPNFVHSLLGLPTRSKAIIAVSAVAILAIAFIMLRVASSPSYATVAAGLAPADTGKYTAALDSAGIGYELQANGSALAVEKTQVAKARIALAGQGLTASSGTARRPASSCSTSRSSAPRLPEQGHLPARAGGRDRPHDQRRLRRVGAQVQLVLPEDDLFADTSSPRPPPVMLSNPADSLEPGAVRGIAQLVASSVKGLKTENVTITDSSGTLLWPNGDTAGAAPGASNKQAAEARYARTLEASLARCSPARSGPGKAQVQVNADLNVDKTTKDMLTYGKTGVPLKTIQETEKLRGSGSASGGTAGTGANIPTYSAGSGAAARTTATTTRAARPTSASTRPSRRPRSPPARSTSCRWR
jgi:flagellar M-ring protein FliF